MASAGGRTDPSLEEVLFESGFRFDFFQAVRVLERIGAGRQPVGRGTAPASEVVRFRSRVALTFPPSAIHEVLRSEAQSQPEMVVAFMGLTGIMGVLPRHYTELLLERARQKDFTLRDFLDLFNHRFISLFYRAWEKYRFSIAYERAVSTRERYDPFSLYLFDIVGLGTAGLRDRLAVEGETVLFYAGLIAQQPHSATALEAMLGDYFEVPVKTRQFLGQWLPLALDQRARLTSNREGSSSMGGAVLGARFWDQQAKFRLRLGPLTFAQFNGLLPGEASLGRLVQLARLFAGQELDFDLQLVLKAAEVPGCRLGKPGLGALRLGWSSWLKTKEFAADADDALVGCRWTRIARGG